MTPFLALSLSPDFQGSEQSARLLGRVPRSFKRLGFDLVHQFSLGPTVLLYMAAPRDGQLHKTHEKNFCLLATGPSLNIDSGARADAAALLSLWSSEGRRALDRIAPPFGGCIGSRQTESINLLTDSCGLAHIYLWEGESYSAASSSCLLLAHFVNAELDTQSLGIHGRVGNYLGEGTPFLGIRKLERRRTCRLQAGKMLFEQDSLDRAPREQDSTRERLIEEGVAVLTRSVQACLNAYSDVSLELSGGLDSRLILAAIPPDLRRGRRAFTLGVPDSPDVAIAKRLAREQRLNHEVIDLSPLADLSPEETLTLIRSSSLASDHCANPFSRGVLDWVNARIERVPRFSGQNGEFARGFYYAGQPDAPSVTKELVESLARWRICVNQAVDLAVFREPERSQVTEDVLSQLKRMLGSYGAPWLDSTDEFYLEGRMQRWVGLDYSSACPPRNIQAPFFHPDFIAWARSVPPALKAGGKIASEVIARLDPGLARIPLDTGFSPHDLLARAPWVRARKQVEFLRKGARKIWQRATGLGRAPVGAETLFDNLLRGGGGFGDLIPRLARPDWINPQWLDSVRAGRRRPDWVTAGFLLNLEWILEFREDASGD